MKRIFFLFFAILLLAGCEMDNDFGPFVRTTYSYPDGTTTTETLEFVAGSDAVVELSLNGLPIQQLKVDGIVTPSNDTVIFFHNITKDHEIFVTLKEKDIVPDTYVVSASAGIGGTINPSGNVTVAKGDSLRVSFTADTDYEIDSVVVDGKLIPTATSYTFSNISANHSIRVVFKKKLKNFMIYATAGSNGSIIPSGNISVVEKQKQNFIPKADFGFKVHSLTVDNTVVDSISSYTFSNVSADHSINANFEKDSIIWHLGKIVWRLDSTYYLRNGEMSIYYDYPRNETWEFLENGTVSVSENGRIYYPTYSVDKNTSPATLIFNVGKVDQSSFKIEVLNNKKMVLYFKKGISDCWAIYIVERYN